MSTSEHPNTATTDVPTILEIATLTLVYMGEDGTEYKQPAADLTESGMLIDPDSGEDMPLVGWYTTQDASVHFQP